MPAGRPEKPIDLNQVEALAAQGLTEGQVADALGICQDTLTSRKKKYSAFSEALKRGQAKGIATVTNALFKEAKGGNVVASIFYLKNRAGWKDRKDIAGDPDNPVVVKEIIRKVID